MVSNGGSGFGDGRWIEREAIACGAGGGWVYFGIGDWGRAVWAACGESCD